MKCSTPGNRAIKVYMDGDELSDQTHTADVLNEPTVFTVPIERIVKGRQPRVTVAESSGAEFSPYWIEFYYRPTTSTRGRKMRRIMAK